MPAREASRGGTVGGFTYRGLQIDAWSAEPSHIAWLTEFLEPWLPVGRGAPPHVTVALTVDADRYRALGSAYPRPGQSPVACFVLDTRTVSHPLWREPDGSSTILDQEFRVFYRVSPAARRVEIVTAWSDGSARIALMRVIRELAMDHARRAGVVVLHAAAVALGEVGLLIAGPKHAGKTTLLVHALEEEGARLVTNDRALVDLSGGGEVRCAGLPSIVGLRPGTLAMFPALSERLRARRYSYVLTLDEGRTCAREGFPERDDGGADLTPAQLCDALGVEAVAEVTAGALVFPRIAPGVRGIALEPLPPAAALARVTESLFGGGVTLREPSVFGALLDGPAAPADALAERARQLVTRVACFDCRLGELTPESRITIAGLARVSS